MSVYRKNARKDMIVELNEDEIKRACLDFIQNRWMESRNDSIEDVKIVVSSEKFNDGAFKSYKICARIEGPEVHDR